MTELEKKELSRRASVMTHEEQEFVATYIPNEILFAELDKRTKRMQTILNFIGNVVELNEEK